MMTGLIIRRRHSGPRRRVAARGAFTLIELLVVVVILAVLMSVLLPTLGRARLQAKVVRVHSDLRQIGLALDAYALDNRERLPAPRLACGLNVECQLPPELSKGNYLPPPPPDVKTPQAQFLDLFNPQHTYKYRAPGPVWYAGTYYDFPTSRARPRSWMWVPTDFPRCADPVLNAARNRYGGFPDEDPPCPARYAVWSMGPEPQAVKFPRQVGAETVDESRFPLPRGLWWQHSGDSGVITHFAARGGQTYQSP